MKHLKFLSFLMLLSIVFVSCENTETAADTYTLNGEFRGVSEGEVFLKYRGDSSWETLDSANLLEGKFEMSGQVNEPQVVYLVTSAFRGGIPVFIENTNISISLHKDSIQEVEIIGSPIQKIYDVAGKKLTEFDQVWQDYYYNTFRFLTDDEKAQNEEYVNQLYDSAQLLKKEFLSKYIADNGSSIASAQILIDQEDAMGTDAMLAAFDALSEQVKLSKPGQTLAERVEIIKKTAIGQPLVDFSMNDTLGNPIKLSEATKGKYVLVDFWAAWCGPCRRENPNVVANYEKYKDQGFDVFGVSFDDKKENWVKAINDDQLFWTQVSDLQGWNNAAGKLYGIKSIPQNILLDPEGIIIEKNLRGAALGEKLEEIFSK